MADNRIPPMADEVTPAQVAPDLRGQSAGPGGLSAGPGGLSADARGLSAGPRHAAGRRRAAQERRIGRPSARLIEVAGLMVGLLAGLVIAVIWLVFRGPAHPPAPATASPAPPVTVSGPVSTGPNPAVLEQEWTAYSDRSTCADWAGGDGVSAYRLNSAQLAWFFSDTYLGPAGPAIGFSRISGFVHNSVVIQSTASGGSTFVTMTGGGACAGSGQAAGPGQARSVVGPPAAPGQSADRYWDADGIELGGTIIKFYNRFLPGSVPFVPEGTVIATYPVSQLSSAGHGPAYGAVAHPELTVLPSYTPTGGGTATSGGTPIVWGAALLRVGDTVYVYGTQTPDSANGSRLLYLARVAASRLTEFSSWQFYAGPGHWAAAQSGALPVDPAGGSAGASAGGSADVSAGGGLSVSSGFSVLMAGGRYWLIQADPVVGSQDIDAYPAATPWGPFMPSAGMVLYRDHSIGLDAAHDFRIMYEARAEPALSTSDTLMISYNVNSEGVTTGCVPMSAYTNTVTQPQFISVPMAVFKPGADLARYRVTVGPSSYPHIAQRDPTQWFDSWAYPSGCPPVPAVSSPRVLVGTATGTATLSWASAGSGIRYRVYLRKPGAAGFTLMTTTSGARAKLARLEPGTYVAKVVPVNFRQTAGHGAEVTFTI
jgi:hypothetical protein